MATASQLRFAQDRLAQFRTRMKASGLDAAVISHVPSLRYFFGFSGSTAMAIVTRKAVHFFTNDLYTVQAAKEVYKHDGLVVHIDRDAWGLVKKLALAKSWKTLGYDSQHTSVAAHARIKKSVTPAKLVEFNGEAESITRVKSASEIKSIGIAADIASETYTRLLGSFVKPGITELAIANYIAATTRELGSTKDAFDIIVVAGKRSAMPHGRASDTVIKSGDVITVDFGCCVDGMYSDMTRTFCVGTPKQKVMDVFGVLYEAHMTALDAAKAGVGASELDGVARSVITRAGYGEYFRHSLGHGLGYEVHESPRVAAPNTAEIIPLNTVITIEPGIYLPGEFGMRIEDDVVVGAKGPRILTSAPRELVIV